VLEAYTALLPERDWAAPGAAAAAIDALPSHPDTTTAKRHIASVSPGLERGTASLELPHLAPLGSPVSPGIELGPSSPEPGTPALEPATAARDTSLGSPIIDGRAEGELSGEIVVAPVAPPPADEPRVVVIEAMDFAEAGEPRQTAEAMGEAPEEVSDEEETRP